MVRRKVLVYGWFGENNYGDELLLKAITKLINMNSNLEICVMGSKPKMIRKNHNCKNYKRISSSYYPEIKRILKTILTDPIDVLYNLKECEVLIIAGGGAISDWNNTSTKEMFYLINYFHNKDKDVYLLGVGAGPIKNEKKGGYFCSVLSKAKCITTRDAYSAKELEKIGLKNVMISNDLALNLYKLFYCKKEKTKIVRNIGLVLVPVCRNTEDIYIKFVQELKILVNKLSDIYENVTLIPFQYEYDKSLYDELLNPMKENIKLFKSDSVWDIESAISEQDLIVGMRFHSIIISLMMGKYVVPIVYHPKNASIAKEFGLMQYTSFIGNGENWDVSNISSNEILEHICNIQNENNYYERIDSLLKTKIINGMEIEIIKGL